MCEYSEENLQVKRRIEKALIEGKKINATVSKSLFLINSENIEENDSLENEKIEREITMVIGDLIVFRLHKRRQVSVSFKTFFENFFEISIE